MLSERAKGGKKNVLSTSQPRTTEEEEKAKIGSLTSLIMAARQALRA